MSRDPADFAVRRPRHVTGTPAAFRAEIRRPDGEASDPMRAEVLDVSRHGFRAATTGPLHPHEAVSLQLEHPDAGLDLRWKAAVRWCRPDENGTWMAGCQFTQPIDWETLGELFLNKVLLSEPDIGVSHRRETE